MICLTGLNDYFVLLLDEYIQSDTNKKATWTLICSGSLLC